MKNNLLQEISISLILIVLLGLFLNPFGFWMPDALVMMIILGLIVVFAIFSGFMWKERAQDEREALHRMLAGRVAYLIGTGILMLGIIVQSSRHEIDSWLVFTLGAMILAKIFGVIYSRKNH